MTVNSEPQLTWFCRLRIGPNFEDEFEDLCLALRIQRFGVQRARQVGRGIQEDRSEDGADRLGRHLVQIRTIQHGAQMVQDEDKCVLRKRGNESASHHQEDECFNKGAFAKITQEHQYISEQASTIRQKDIAG